MSLPSPQMPLTLEGAALLHQMFRINWSAWRSLDSSTRDGFVAEFSEILHDMGAGTGLFSMYGHKGDFMLVHFRPDFEALNACEWRIRKSRFWQVCEPATSYVSVVELGLYESTGKVYGGLLSEGVTPHSDTWKSFIHDTLERQRKAMEPRLFPEIPPAKYCCFYPMDRRRGEDKNWYTLPLEERAALMHEHGLVGRRYAGEVRQIISGSIGFDDWEWGVDLFADDALVFKKLIYEMRFDPVSAIYAQFGPFYLGLRYNAETLSRLLSL
jgi:chlorite dismutase